MTWSRGYLTWLCPHFPLALHIFLWFWSETSFNHQQKSAKSLAKVARRKQSYVFAFRDQIARLLGKCACVCVCVGR